MEGPITKSVLGLSLCFQAKMLKEMKGNKRVCKISMDTSLHLSSLQFSSTYVAGNIPTVPRSSPSHQPSSCLSWMLMTSPALMLSSSYMLAVQSYNARQVPMLGASRPVDPAELKDSKGFFFSFFLFMCLPIQRNLQKGVTLVYKTKIV